MLLLAIADDTTGALEVGAKLAAQGVRALVTTDLTNWPDAPALVVDTQSRQLSPSQARRRVAEVAAVARQSGVPYLYKKTDSTLRGNIVGEFQGLLDVFPDRRLVYVPAYPAMGRTVVNGELYVDGQPLARTAFARDGSIAALLGPMEPGAVTVCDGESDDDLRAAADALAGDGRPSIAAGPAGFVEYWARALPLERGYLAPPRQAVKCCLVLSGSMHPASIGQIRRGAASGIETLYLGDNQPDFTAAFSVSSWVALATLGHGRAGVSDRLGALARPVLESGMVDGLVVFGGNTVFAALHEIGVSVVASCGELLPGIPVSLAQCKGRELVLVTKAGGFGTPTTLLSIRQHLENGT